MFRLLDPEQFRASLQKFMGKFSRAYQGVVAIDGKVLRRSFDKASGKSPLHMVSAWGCDQCLVLAQIATDAKSPRGRGIFRGARQSLPTRPKPAL